MRKRPPARFWWFLVALVAVLGLFPLYSHFKQQAAPVPPGVRLGGLDLSHLKQTDDIRAQLEPILAQPIGVRFRNRTLLLRPEEIDYTLQLDQMMAEAARYLEGPPFVDIAVREAIGLPQQVRDVPMRYSYDDARLRAWLAQAAAQLDYPAVPARALPEKRTAAATALTATATVTATQVVSGAAPGPAPAVVDWRWTPGEPGYAVDIAGSIPRILDALSSTDRRMADLALIVAPPAAAGMADLAATLARVGEDFPGTAGIYVRDLRTGEEALVNGDVAFSGAGTLHVPLGVLLMQRLRSGVPAGNDLAQQQGQSLDYALGASNNYFANELLAWLGDGDLDAGAQRFGELARSLGLESTYIQRGFDAAVRPALATPGNRRLDTGADPNLQTTPQELGRLLAMIYECAEGRGQLIETFPTELRPDECATLLFYMTHDQMRDLVWNGLPDPDQRWILHHYGLSATQHGDVALVWGPTGPYVISVFLAESGWLDWELSRRTMNEISRVVWNFFEYRRAQGDPAPTPPPRYAPPGGYRPVDVYAPSAANPDAR
jgi:hypothetical protein